jgi:RimJ/RimL family protein N-acetyltransferase
MGDPSAGEVLLRDVIEADLPTFFAQQLDPQATDMAAFPARARDPFMKHWARIMADKTNTLKTILFNGEVAGNIVSWDQDDRREVGYWLGREFWGKGVATRALLSMLGYVTRRPMYAHVAKHNVASRRVLEKCGFRIVGSDRTLSGIPGEPVEELILRLD